MGNNGLGFFVSGSKGYMVDLINGEKKTPFTLNLSQIFKSNSIVDYEVYDNMIYLLTSNGLLYSWHLNSETFSSQIQTSLKFPLLSPPESGTIQYIKIKDGIVAINCTHGLYSSI